MTKQIDYTFKIDGFCDVVNYYRSETPMNHLSMPAPTTTGITGLIYSDTTASNNIKYYVRFGSVKNNIEKISDEIEVVIGDPLDSYVVSFINFADGIVDKKGNVWAARSVTTYISGGELIVGGGNNDGLRCNDANFLNFGTGAFCFECIGKITASKLADGFLTNGLSAWGANGAVLRLLDYSKMSYIFYDKPAITAASAIVINQEVHLAWSRDATGTMRMFANGVLVKSDAYGHSVNFSLSGAVLFGYSWENTSPAGRFKAVRITKGHARYTTNFVPPLHF